METPTDEQAIHLQKIADNFMYISVVDEPKISCNGIIAIIDEWNKIKDC